MATRLLAPVLLAFSGTASATTAPAASVPVLDNWGLLGLGILAGLAGMIAIRRGKK